MGVCLSKGGQHHHGHMLGNDEDGFCTPECVSSQYESPNASGRYSFAHLETPRVSADVGDFGVLGSLFYMRGSRSRDNNDNTTTTANYISPLDLFLGGVSGRNRVHHVNQICAGDLSFASYLASPLLKGFDVHAMEAVAKSYAESAAKAAARDTFVFLEENDVSVSSFQGGGVEGNLRKVSTSSAAAAAADDYEDVDDDLAKSGESEEWEEPRKSENWDEAVSSSSTLNKNPHFRASNERGTSDRLSSVLNAVQARAKARRRLRRKSSMGKGQGTKERSGGGGRKKTVRFQLDGVHEGLTDDDIRSGKDSELDQALETEEAGVLRNSREAGTAAITAQQSDSNGDDNVENLERLSKDNSEPGPAVSLEAAAAEEECDYYLWQDGDEAIEECGDGGEMDRHGEVQIIEAEFAGFTASEVLDGLRATASEVFDGLRASSEGGATTLSLAPPHGPAAAGAVLEHHAHMHRPSGESFSSGEYYLPETSFGSSQEQGDDTMDLTGLPLPEEDDEDEATSSGPHHGLVLEEDENGEETETFRGGDAHANEFEDHGRQHCPANYTCEAPSVPPADILCVGGRMQQEMASFMKDISLSDDGAAAATPPAIPVGCVVVESRLADGSRLNPQILDPSDVQLPERGENNYGFYHARVLCTGESSPSESDPNSDHEGSFSFPVLLPSVVIPSPEKRSLSSSSFRETGGGAFLRDPPLADLETPIKNRSIRLHPPQPPSLSSTTPNPVHEIHEMSSPRYEALPEDKASCGPRSSFSFDVEQTMMNKKTHEIVLPTLSSRSLSSSPVFSPSKVVPQVRSSVAAASPPVLPAVSVSSIPYPPKARRSFNRKLKFYSLERASYAAAGAKRSKSPPSFSKQSRERRRDADGDSDSDLFEIETMSGTNAMGSSRTPPSTPTKTPSKKPPAAASFDFEKLSDSIALVSRSRSKRNSVNSPIKTAPVAPSRNSKARCLPVERRDSVFQEGGEGAATTTTTTKKSMAQNSLKGRAFLKLGLLMRSKHCPQQHHARSDHSRDSDLYRSSETSGSEYLENKPPSPAAAAAASVRYSAINGQCGQCMEERTANHNYAFEWYCSSMTQRVAPLRHEKRQQQQDSLSSHNCSFGKEDRTFAVKN